MKDAVAAARANGEPMSSAVRNIPELAQAVPAAELRALDDPSTYLGSAEAVRRRLLSDVPAPSAGDH